MTFLHWYALIGVPAILLSMAGLGYVWISWLTSRDDARIEADRLPLGPRSSRPRA